MRPSPAAPSLLRSATRPGGAGTDRGAGTDLVERRALASSTLLLGLLLVVGYGIATGDEASHPADLDGDGKAASPSPDPGDTRSEETREGIGERDSSNTVGESCNLRGFAFSARPVAVGDSSTCIGSTPVVLLAANRLGPSLPTLLPSGVSSNASSTDSGSLTTLRSEFCSTSRADSRQSHSNFSCTALSTLKRI